MRAPDVELVFKVCWISTNERAYLCAADASARAACDCDWWTASSPPVPPYSRAVACRGPVWPANRVVLRQRAVVRIARLRRCVLENVDRAVAGIWDFYRGNISHFVPLVSGVEAYALF